MKTLIKTIVILSALATGVTHVCAQSVNQIAIQRIKEAGSAAQLTEEGRHLYRADRRQESWGQYCATAWREI